MKMKTAIEQPGRFGCAAVMIAVFALVLSLALVLPGGDVDAGINEVEVDGTTTTLSSAIISAGETETVIKLTADVIESVQIGANQTITINLNGHTISDSATARDNEPTAHNTITNNGNLTIIGTGMVENLTHGSAALVNNEGATATLSGGSFERPADKGTIISSSKTDSGGNSFYTVQNFGTMTINDGVSISNVGCGSSTLANGWSKDVHSNNAVMTINGGTVCGGLHAVKNDNAGKLTVNGGSFSAGSENTSFSNLQYVILNAADITINGGTFQTTAKAIYAFCSDACSDNAYVNIDINGGIFGGNLLVRSIPEDFTVEGTGGPEKPTVNIDLDIGVNQLTIYYGVSINGTVCSNGNIVKFNDVLSSGSSLIVAWRGNTEDLRVGGRIDTGTVTCSGPSLFMNSTVGSAKIIVTPWANGDKTHILWSGFILNDGTVEYQDADGSKVDNPSTVCDQTSVNSSFDYGKITDSATGSFFVGDKRVLALESEIENYTWRSSDPSIATVSDDGTVTGIAPGTVIIYADVEGYMPLGMSMTVKAVPTKGITLDQSETTMTTEPGKNTIALVATVSPSNATNKTVEWTSSDASVATVSDGVVTALKGGEVTITATASGTKYTASCTIKVEQVYTVTIVANSGGSVDVDYFVVSPGGDVSFNVSVDSGYVLDSVTANGIQIVGYDGMYTLEGIDSNIVVNVVFEPVKTTTPWDDEDEEYVPIIPPVVTEDVASDDDDSVTVVACAAAAAVAALMAVFLLLDRKR